MHVLDSGEENERDLDLGAGAVDEELCSQADLSGGAGGVGEGGERETGGCLGVGGRKAARVGGVVDPRE